MGTHPIFESDFDCLTVMDRYEPFTRSIDNRDGFQITRPVSPMRMMSDIERRMAENERKMAELADEEERLARQGARFGMEPSPSSSRRPFDEPPQPSSPYRPESPTKERAESSYQRKSARPKESSSKRRSRSRSFSPMRERSSQKQPKTDDVIVIDDDERSSRKKRKQSPEVSKKYKEAYKPPVVYHKPPPQPPKPPVVYHHQEQEQQPQMAPYMVYDERAPAPPQPQQAVHLANRHLPQNPPQSTSEDAFNADLRAAVASGQLKMSEKEILLCGPQYGQGAKRESNPECAIYVGNLLIDKLSKDDMFHIFREYGEIESISFFKTSSCYVQFTTRDAVNGALNENGRMLHDSPIQVAPKTMSPENSRKLPRDGAAKRPLRLGRTPQCRLFVESDNERYYATRIERKLRCLGVTCDTVIWKQPINRKGYSHLNKHLEYLERDPSSLCSIEITADSSQRHIITVHFFKPEGEEHRNMPVVDAILLVFNRIQSMRPDEAHPPGLVRHLMSLISSGKRATLDEVEQTIGFLEERRIQLGGKKRFYRGLFNLVLLD